MESIFIYSEFFLNRTPSGPNLRVRFRKMSALEGVMKFGPIYIHSDTRLLYNRIWHFNGPTISFVRGYVERDQCPFCNFSTSVHYSTEKRNNPLRILFQVSVLEGFSTYFVTYFTIKCRLSDLEGSTLYGEFLQEQARVSAWERCPVWGSSPFTYFLDWNLYWAGIRWFNRFPSSKKKLRERGGRRWTWPRSLRLHKFVKAV